MPKHQPLHPLQVLKRPVRLIALAAALAAGCEGDCTAPDQMRVSGNVRLDSQLVPAWEVELEQDGVRVTSTLTGTGQSFSYEFTVAAGPYTVRVVPKAGTYCPVTAREVNGIAGDEVTANFECSTALNASLVTAHNHNTGTQGQTDECGQITTAPAQPVGSARLRTGIPGAAVIGAGAAYTVTVTGPTEGGASGIIAGQPPIAGVLGADGTARYQIRINRFGTYASTATITSVLGVVRTASATNTVGAAAGVCP